MRHEIWQKLRDEANEVVSREPLLASHVYSCVLNHECLGSALSFIVANKLADAFNNNFAQFAGNASEEILAAAPKSIKINIL